MIARTTVLALVLASVAFGWNDYRTKIFKPQLTLGTHTNPLQPEGMNWDEYEARKNDTTPVGEDAKLLTHIDQDLYFPSVEYTVSEQSGQPVVTNVAITFSFELGVPNFVIPPFSLEILGNHGKSLYQDDHRVTANYSFVTIPVTEDLSQEDVIEFRLKTRKWVVTSYEYILESIPEDVLDGRMYDLNPANASMMFKFLTRFDKDEDTLGVWMSRRSPIPDFTLVLGRDGRPIAHHSATAVPPGGLGLQAAFKEVSKNMLAKHSIVIHFYERYLEPTAKVELSPSQMDEMITALRGGDSSAPFKDKAEYEVQTDERSTTFHFRYVNDTKHVAVLFKHGRPLESAMISVYDVDDRLLFREEERLVPFNPDEPFGWYYVVAAAKLVGEDDEKKIEETDEKIRRIKRVEVYLKDRRPVHPAELMSQWINENGGDVHGVKIADHVQKAFDDGKGQTHAVLRLRGLASVHNFFQNDTIASIPYRLLLTNRVVQHNEWCRQVLLKANQTYTELAKKHGFQPDGIYFMLLTFFAIAQPNHPIEGTNWRLYFDTFPKDHPPLPAFYSDAELAMFDFSPTVRRDAQKMREMWHAEYDLLTEHVSWLTGYCKPERYLSIRSQIESRVINASGTLLMLPLMDFMNHDDDNNVEISYRDSSQEMIFRAARIIREGQALTTNYGSNKLTKRDFLIQFGFIPVGAIDAVDISFNGETYYLTPNVADSARILKIAINKDLKGAVGDDDDDEDFTTGLDSQQVREKFDSLLQARRELLPHAIPESKAAEKLRGGGVSHLLREGLTLKFFAERLLKSEAEILDKHLQASQGQQ